MEFDEFPLMAPMHTVLLTAACSFPQDEEIEIIAQLEHFENRDDFTLYTWYRETHDSVQLKRSEPLPRSYFFGQTAAYELGKVMEKVLAQLTSTQKTNLTVVVLAKESTFRHKLLSNIAYRDVNTLCTPHSLEELQELCKVTSL